MAEIKANMRKIAARSAGTAAAASDSGRRGMTEAELIVEMQRLIEITERLLADRAVSAASTSRRCRRRLSAT